MRIQPPSLLWPEEAPAVEPEPGPFACPVCNSDTRKAPIACCTPDADPSWRLLRCAGCGCGLFSGQAGMPDYADAGMTGAATTYFLQQGAAVAVFADILARLSKPPGSTYVEIGCGFGFGLDVGIHAMGWQCRGMDPAQLAEVGRALLGLDITLAYFDPSTVGDASCDIVMATEVLEHLPDPIGFLAEVRRGLRPDGIVVLTTPDVAAVRPAIAKGALNATLSIGLHLILHSRQSLAHALTTAGFPHVRIESDGWKLTAFASAVPLDLREEVAEREAIVTRYLVGRAEARAEADDLYIGFAGRALFAAVSAQDGTSAERVWARLDRELQKRYRIKVDTISHPPEGVGEVPFHDIEAIMPFNLAVIMLARAYQRLQAGESRPALRRRFAAIRQVCGPLSSRLEQQNIGDMQTRQILWVAAAEEVLCVAAEGRGSLRRMMTALPESPTGAGRADILHRSIELLLHGERPFRAAYLARSERLPHMRVAGDIWMGAMVEAFARECGYGVRRALHGR